MPGFASLSLSEELAALVPGGGVYAEQLYQAVLDGDEERVHALLAAVLGVNGRLLLERQHAQLDIIESLLGSMRRVALFDVLTGAYNRRGFLHVGARMLEGLQRQRRGALVLYVDVDDIKRVNDTDGHGAGDRQLRDAVAVLERAAGPGALLGRLGGDEFAAIVSGRPEDHGALLERIQYEVTACNTCAGGHGLPLSLSVGTAVFDPLQPVPLAALLEQADRLMYGEKTGKSHRSLQVRMHSL